MTFVLCMLMNVFWFETTKKHTLQTSMKSNRGLVTSVTQTFLCLKSAGVSWWACNKISVDDPEWFCSLRQFEFIEMRAAIQVHLRGFVRLSPPVMVGLLLIVLALMMVWSLVMSAQWPARAGTDSGGQAGHTQRAPKRSQDSSFSTPYQKHEHQDRYYNTNHP